MIEKREINIALLRGDAQWHENKHVIAEEPWCIISSNPIIMEQLFQISWVQYEASTITGSEEQLLNWWQEQFSFPHPNIIKVDSIEACIQMVSHGLGWCIAPKIHIINRRSLFSSPVIFRDGHTMVRKTVMLYRNEILEQPVNRLFIDHVLRNYSAS